MSKTVPARPSGRVFIVDPDTVASAALRPKLAALGYTPRCAETLAGFVATPARNEPSCILIDVSPGDLSPLAVHEHLRDGHADAGVVFIASHADVTMAVTAMKRGAVDFLLKPLRMSELMPAVEAALAHSRRKREARQHAAEALRRLARLTPRERDVFTLVVHGKRNKAIAEALGSQESTVKVHRSRLMKKLEVASLADLLRIAREVDRGKDGAADDGGI